MLNKKVFCLLLALLITGSITACSASETENDPTAGVEIDTEAATETEDPYDPRLPEKTFDGRTFTFGLRGVEGESVTAATVSIVDITVSESVGELYNDAVYDRQFFMEETYDVSLQSLFLGTSNTSQTGGEMYAKVQNIIASGTDELNALICTPTNSYGMAITDLTLPLNTLPYIDLTRSWWDQSSVNSLTINGQLFSVDSDVSMRNKLSIVVLVFNKEIENRYQLDSHYEKVYNGEWTLDAMLANCQKVVLDLDGNGIWNNYDQYGYLFGGFSGMSHMHAAGATITTLDSDNKLTYTYKNEHFINAYQRLIQLCSDPSNISSVVDYSDDYSPFGNGNALYGNIVTASVLNFRDLDFDFGIIPQPKYDETQQNYYSSPYIGWSSLLCVPINTDTEFSGYILEAFAAKGSEILRPVFINNLVTTAYVRDEDSANMLDIIFNSVVYDIGAIFDFGGIAAGISDYCGRKNDTVVSMLNSKHSQAESDMQTFNETWKEN